MIYDDNDGQMMFGDLEPHLRRKTEELKKTWDHENTINHQAAAKGKQWEKAEEFQSK